jgi:phospholipid/cholesterol/gamma-HCH transport system substrate-binding protein
METRANYVLIGVFTLIVIVGGFGFVWWFERAGSMGTRAAYDVVYHGSIAGLRPGSAVNFNGVRVGEVYAVRLDAGDPRRVIVQIGVDSHIPVRADTKAGLETQGLTGIAAVSLTGGRLDAPPIAAEEGALPRLRAESTQTQDLMQSARTVMGRVDQILIENEDHIKEAIASIGAAAKSVQLMADSLGEVAEPTLKEYQALARDARRAVADLSRFVRELEKNPSQIIWGRGNPPAPGGAR